MVQLGNHRGNFLGKLIDFGDSYEKKKKTIEKLLNCTNRIIVFL